MISFPMTSVPPGVVLHLSAEFLLSHYRSFPSWGGAGSSERMGADGSTFYISRTMELLKAAKEEAE